VFVLGGAMPWAPISSSVLTSNGMSRPCGRTPYAALAIEEVTLKMEVRIGDDDTSRSRNLHIAPCGQYCSGVTQAMVRPWQPSNTILGFGP
jgi:hypothetical protein